MSPWGLLQSSNAARDGGRSRRGKNKPLSLRTQTQTPANLFSLKKGGNKWKALKRHGQPHLGEPRRILLDNCIVGTRGRVSFRVIAGNSTGRGRVPGLMPQEIDVQQERCNVCLALILAGLLLLSLGASERQCQRPSPEAQNGYCDTYIRSRITELPLKLMTVLTVIISKSSWMSRGPLMGRVITRVALIGPVCCGQNQGALVRKDMVVAKGVAGGTAV